MRCCREVTWIGCPDFFSYPSLYVNLYCCDGWTIMFQGARTIKVVRHNMDGRVDIQTKIHLIEVLMEDNNNRFLEDVGQNAPDFRANTCL